MQTVSRVRTNVNGIEWNGMKMNEYNHDLCVQAALFLHVIWCKGGCGYFNLVLLDDGNFPSVQPITIVGKKCAFPKTWTWRLHRSPLLVPGLLCLRSVSQTL
jgi:hypothetical protein